MDFKFCLLGALLAQITSLCMHHVIDDIIRAIYSNREEGKIPKMVSSRFGNKNLNYSALSEYFSMPFWLIIDINGPYPQ